MTAPEEILKDALNLKPAEKAELVEEGLKLLEQVPQGIRE